MKYAVESESRKARYLTTDITGELECMAAGCEDIAISLVENIKAAGEITQFGKLALSLPKTYEVN